MNFKCFTVRKIVYICSLICLCLLFLGCADCGKMANSKKAAAGVAQSNSGYQVTDSQGYRFTMTAKPQHIVSLSISTDEILMALVEPKRIAAITFLADDPGISNVVEQAKQISGRVKDTNPEALLLHKPDLIIIPDFIKPEVIQCLRDMKINVYVYKTPYSIAGVERNILELGHLVGEEARAREIVADMEKRLAHISQKLESVKQQKRIIFHRNGGAYFSPRASFNDLCKYAKVKNALLELNYSHAAEIAQEEVIRLNPDIYIISGWNYDGKHDVDAYYHSIASNPAYYSTRAVQNKAVYILPGKHLFCISQYMLEGVEDIAKVAYSDLM